MPDAISDIHPVVTRRYNNWQQSSFVHVASKNTCNVVRHNLPFFSFFASFYLPSFPPWFPFIHSVLYSGKNELAKDKLMRHSEERSTMNGLAWEEAEVAAVNSQEWQQSVYQWIHMDVGRISVKKSVLSFVSCLFLLSRAVPSWVPWRGLSPSGKLKSSVVV